jgi:hypothetical protein
MADGLSAVSRTHTPHGPLDTREAAIGRSLGTHRSPTSQASCRSLLLVRAAASRPTHAMRTSARVWACTRARRWPSSREDAASFATAHRHRGAYLERCVAAAARPPPRMGGRVAKKCCVLARWRWHGGAPPPMPHRAPSQASVRACSRPSTLRTDLHQCLGPLLPRREHVAVHWGSLPRCVPM